MSDRHIMVVDDDLETLEFIVDFLIAYGYKVTTCYASSLAIEQVQHLQPDLVVLDHQLPVPPNGWGIFVALRAEPTTAHIPVILYSAEHMVLQLQHDQVRSMSGDVLKKPFQAEELLAKIEALTNTVTK